MRMNKKIGWGRRCDGMCGRRCMGYMIYSYWMKCWMCRYCMEKMGGSY